MISVVMCSYNTKEGYLRHAIESILNQGYKDFEFIIVDDKSTDNSIDIIKSYKDSRITLICNEKNMGLTRSLNVGISNTKGKYIARMDADDISLPKRLVVQLEYMEDNPDKVLCGSLAIGFGEDIKDIHTHFTNDDELNKIKLLFSTVLVHPTVMMRSDVLKYNNIRYDERYKKTQDYKMWIDLSKVGSLGFIKQPLLKYRWHKNQISASQSDEQNLCSYKICNRYWRDLGFKLCDNEFKYLHNHVFKKAYIDAKMTSKIIENIIKQNKKKRIFNPYTFNKHMYYVYLKSTFKYFNITKNMDFIKTKIFYKSLNPIYYYYYFNILRTERRITFGLNSLEM